MPDTNVATHPDVRVAPAAPAARLLLRGDPAALGPRFGVALPTAPCTAAPGTPSALWLGPDEWLLLAPPGQDWDAWDGEEGAAVDVGHRQVGLRVEGALAEATLAAACPLDLCERHFPVGRCTRTVFGKAEIVLWRIGPRLFHLEVWRSFAAYVEQLLAVAAADARAL